MNIETRKCTRDSSRYEAFGWKVVSQGHARSGHHWVTEYTLERDKDIPHYDEIRRLEYEYFELDFKMHDYLFEADDIPNPLIVVITFLLFVFPMFIYLSYFKKKKAVAYANADNIYEQMNELTLRAKTLLNNR